MHVHLLIEEGGFTIPAISQQGFTALALGHRPPVEVHHRRIEVGIGHCLPDVSLFHRQTGLMYLHLIGEVGVFDLRVELFAGSQFLGSGFKAVAPDEGTGIPEVLLHVIDIHLADTWLLQSLDIIKVLAPFLTDGQFAGIVLDLIQFLSHIEVGTQQLVLGHIGYLFHQLDTAVEGLDRLLVVDIVVDDTNLLVGEGPSEGVVLLLGKLLHLFSLTEGGLRATGIGAALNDVAPGFIERVPKPVFLHPVLLLPGLFLQTHPVLRVIDQRETFIASCLFIIQVAFFLGIQDPLVADAEYRVHLTRPLGLVH